MIQHYDADSINDLLKRVPFDKEREIILSNTSLSKVFLDKKVGSNLDFCPECHTLIQDEGGCSNCQS